MTTTIGDVGGELGRGRLFPSGARAWLAIVLAWQLVGLAGSLALALPWGDFHPFVKWLIVGLTFTNLMGLLASGIALAYRKWLHRMGADGASRSSRWPSPSPPSSPCARRSTSGGASARPMPGWPTATTC